MRDSRKRTAALLIILGVISIAFIAYGLYVRFPGGNASGVVYILIGGLIAVGASVVTFFIARQK